MEVDGKLRASRSLVVLPEDWRDVRLDVAGLTGNNVRRDIDLGIDLGFDGVLESPTR